LTAVEKKIDFKALAGQLANPTGEMGIKVAENMNISNAKITRHAIDLLDCKDNDRILEIGPGNGLFVPHVLSKGKNIHYSGVDISETMIHSACKLNASSVQSGQAHFQQTDGVTLPFVNNSFDRVFTVNTLYFWAQPALQLAEIRRVLKTGGLFCLAIVSKAFMATLPFTPYGFTLYSPDEAQALLSANGFKLVDVEIRHHKVLGAVQKKIFREEVFITVQ